MKKSLIVCLFLFPFFGVQSPEPIPETPSVETVEMKLDNLNREITELNKLIECVFVQP